MYLCRLNYSHILEMPVTWCLSLLKQELAQPCCSSTNESVELLGKEPSSDHCHMMQEVCQHFSSSSLAIRRGTRLC